MLPTATSYEELQSSFEWQIPEHYNMGVDVCDRWAKEEPDRTALIDLTGDKRIDVSYSILKNLSDNLAQHLRKLGIERGDRVGIYRTQSAWTAAAHIAIWKLGAVSIPLFKLFGEQALAIRLEDSSANAVVTDQDGEAALLHMKSDLPKLENIIVPENIRLEEAIGFEAVGTTADEPAVLIYTSGTTGAPKGALHGHRILLGHLPGVEMSHNLLSKEGEILWTPADWAWIGGLFDVLMPGLQLGVPVVAGRMAKFNVEACLDIIRAGGVRNIFFPATALRFLKSEGATIDGLHSIASGGEPLGAEMLQWGRDALGLTINEFYGQTECNMVISSCVELFDPRPGFMGKVVPGHEVAVVDEHGKPTNDEGDIAIRRGTPVMMLEYWKNEKATREKFRGDWLLTGDRGVMEDDFIKFVGRDDDVITSSGYRMGPTEIEDCLITHNAVATAGVIGKPDQRRTEIIKAYVVLKPGYKPTPELVSKLQNHVKNKLAKHEYPREIAFVDMLPMTVTGKIVRRQLREMAIAELQNEEIT